MQNGGVIKAILLDNLTIYSSQFMNNFGNNGGAI